MRWDEGEMGRSGGGHTVLRDVRCCAAVSAPPRATSALAGGVEMGWDGMGRDGARGGAQWQGRACGGMEGEGWERDGWEEGEGMGEEVARRHTCNRRVEDVEDVPAPRGLEVWRGVVDPSPLCPGHMPPV